MRLAVLVALAAVLGFYVGRWDEAHSLTWRGRWDVFAHRFGKHAVSEYSGKCLVCDRQIADPPEWTKGPTHKLVPPNV